MHSNKVKICFIFDRYWPSIGGAQTLMKEIAESLVKEGFEVTILTLKLNGAKSMEKLNGVSIYRINSSFGRLFFEFSLLLSVLLNRQIRNVIKESDLIHTAALVGPRAAYLLSRLYKKPIVNTVYEVLGKSWFYLEPNFFKKRIYFFIEKLTFKLNFDKFVGISYYTKNCMRTVYGVKDSRLRTIYCSLDADLYGFKANKKIIEKYDLPADYILSFGRPGLTKGINFLVESIDLIKTDITLVLILSKDPVEGRTKIEDLIKNLKNKDKIIVLDSLPKHELYNIIFFSKLVVVPSLTEGFGFSAAESSFFGKPVIATNIGSLPEVIKDKETGILVDPANPRALAEGIEYLFPNHNLIKKFSKNGSAYIKKFNRETMIKQYVCLYRELLR